MIKLTSTNPSRNFEVLGEVESSTQQEVISTIKKAKNAQITWSSLSLKERCNKIKSFIDISEKRKEEIAQLIATEVGRPIDGSRANVDGGISYFEAYMRMAEEHLSPQVTSETDKEIHRVYREPWGVVAAICPWNYPFMNVTWQCGQAIIAGNTIVYKNSEKNPLFSNLLAELIADSDIPDGVFNVLYGDSQVGQWIVEGDIDMISFTGSTKTGQILAKIAAEKFIPIVAELGGSTPAVVFEDVEVDDIAEHIYDRRFKVNGQACDAVKRLIVHESKLNELVHKLCEVIKTKKIGAATDEDTDIGPLVDMSQLELLESQVKDAVDKGATVMVGGKRPNNLKGSYYLPTVLTGITQDMRVWQEEVFGPVLPVIPFATEEAAIGFANDTQYGLSAHVFTNDKKRFQRVASQIRAGIVAQNKVVYWSPHHPFGGYKKSGIGRIHGQFGFDEVTQIKLVSEEK